MANLLADLPDDLPSELIETLAQSESVRIERIVSLGHVSPADFWYDQEENEWVALLSGGARLQFEDEEIELRPGDWIVIPAHRKHRVAWTKPGEHTVWLAVFYR